MIFCLLYFLSYFGDEKGELIKGKAGSVVVFSSFALHKSGENISEFNRAALSLQYGTEPLEDPETGDFLHSAEPFIMDGGRIVNAM